MQEEAARAEAVRQQRWLGKQQRADQLAEAAHRVAAAADAQADEAMAVAMLVGGLETALAVEDAQAPVAAVVAGQRATDAQQAEAAERLARNEVQKVALERRLAAELTALREVPNIVCFYAHRPLMW